MATNQELYSPIARSAADQYGIPADLFTWQIGQESSWNPLASNGLAQGIAQFIPSTAKAFSVDVNDPVSSIYGAAAYDASLYQKYGDWGRVLQKYGTVGSSSPASVLEAANEQLAALGAQPISSESGATNDASTSATAGHSVLSILPSPNDAENFIFGFSFDRLVFVVLGLILIAGGLYTLKSVQSVVNTTIQGGVGAGAHAASKAALGAVTL